jgi:hypothetical protein
MSRGKATGTRNVKSSLRKNGHCMVPRRREKDKSHGTWVAIQQGDKMRPDHKDLLEDKLEFVWHSDGLHKSNWNEQHEKWLDFAKKTATVSCHHTGTRTTHLCVIGMQGTQRCNDAERKL